MSPKQRVPGDTPSTASNCQRLTQRVDFLSIFSAQGRRVPRFSICAQLRGTAALGRAGEGPAPGTTSQLAPHAGSSEESQLPPQGLRPRRLRSDLQLGRLCRGGGAAGRSTIECSGKTRLHSSTSLRGFPRVKGTLSIPLSDLFLLFTRPCGPGVRALALRWLLWSVAVSARFSPLRSGRGGLRTSSSRRRAGVSGWAQGAAGPRLCAQQRPASGAPSLLVLPRVSFRVLPGPHALTSPESRPGH